MLRSADKRRLPPVELVVAEGRGLIAEEVEQIDYRRALVEIGEQAALHFVAGIKQHDVCSADAGAYHIADDVADACDAGVAASGFQAGRENHWCAGP